MKVRLSGFAYIREYGYRRTKIGDWYTEVGDDTFKHCEDKRCPHSREHEYAFDGQFFYKKATS